MAKTKELVNHTHLPGVVRFDLFSGVSVDVTPVSQMTIIKFRDKARELFPDPDGEKWRKPLPGAAVEGQTYIDVDDPAYKEAVSESEFKRDAWFRENLYTIAVEPTPPDTREEIIERFRPQIEKLSQIVDMPKDEWVATLLHAVFTSNDDIRDIQRLLILNAPITFEEVADGLRIFRLKVSKSNRAEVVTDRTQGDDEIESNE